MDHDPGVGADRGAPDGNQDSDADRGLGDRREGTGGRRGDAGGSRRTPPCMVRQAAATTQAPATAATQAALA